MTADEILKKLTYCEKNLKQTTKKRRRLDTAERKWRQRVQYYTIALTEAAKQSAAPLQPVGRKFRD